MYSLRKEVTLNRQARECVNEDDQKKKKILKISFDFVVFFVVNLDHKKSKMNVSLLKILNVYQTLNPSGIWDIAIKTIFPPGNVFCFNVFWLWHCCNKLYVSLGEASTPSLECTLTPHTTDPGAVSKIF